MNITGRIHSFESFGTLDGPGIRFVAFLQGCPLRCLYCHNRDTWDPSAGTVYTAEEVFDRLLRYQPYFESSGGGVTLSGGEPTLQADFAAALFEKCRNAGIHTALDTNGHADPARIAHLLEATDLILLDIKHATPSGHLKLTGADRALSAKFAAYTVSKGIPVWIRYVLVPGLTDSEEDLTAAAGLLSSMDNLQKVEVLPYHSAGRYKWEEMGLAYPLADTPEPSAELVERARQILVPQHLR